MFELFNEINWILLGSLLIVSAVVAWAGDIIGMKLGKKRITFLKLRPKYTSRIISVITGIGIAFATLFVISLTSETVRTALFSMNYVQNQVTNLTAELQKNRTNLQEMEVELFQNKGALQDKQEELKVIEKKLAAGTKSLNEANIMLAEMKDIKGKTEKEQAELQKKNARLELESKKLEESVKELKTEADNLKAGIQMLREGRIAALTGEKLAQVLVSDTVTTEEQVNQSVERLSEESQALLAYRFGTKPEFIKKPVIDKESVETAKKQVLKKPGRYLLRLTALANAIEGEPVDAELRVYETRLIFKAKDVLAERDFAPGTNRQQIEDLLLRSLKDVNTVAAKEGVLRDPLSGNVGSMDTAEFMNAIEKIAESKTDIKLKIVAAEDIYTEGPVRIKFILK